MKDSKKNTIVIVIILSIVVLIFGSTYAYFQWRTTTAQQTSVNFTISAANMGATFTGSGTLTSTSIEPSACDAAIKEMITVSYYNETPYPATLSVDLVTNRFAIRSTTYKPTADNLNYLHWAITDSSTCVDPADTDAGRTGIVNTTDISPSTSDNFAEFADTFSTTTSSITPTIATISFNVPANSGTESSPLTKTYYLYIWLDKNYTHINEGSVNSDPMQGINFIFKWQNANMIQRSS